MATLWDAFLEDYKDEIIDWPLRFTLETFWYYCQDGDRKVAEFLKHRKKLQELQTREVKK